MAVDIEVRFRGALDADVDTDYRLLSDKASTGIFVQVGTDQDATTPFAPVSTTLNQGGVLSATETDIIFTDGTNFSEGDVVVIDREPILLGTKATNTFNGCTRAYGGVAMATTHADDTAVYKMHETFTDLAVNFGSRKCIRYQVQRVEGTDVSVVTETVKVLPPVPPTSDFCTVWGLIQDFTNDVQASLTATLAIGATGAFMVGTGEQNIKENETAQSDADGFWSVSVPKTIAISGGGTLTISIEKTGQTYTRNISTVPDQDAVHWTRATVAA